MDKQTLKLKLTNAKAVLLKRPVMISIGAGAAVLVVTLLGGLLIARSQANAHAEQFNNELNAYVTKLTTAKSKKIDNLKAAAENPPVLKSVSFGGSSASYKQAQAKAAILGVYQSQIFAPLASYNSKDAFADDLQAAQKLNETRTSNSFLEVETNGAEQAQTTNFTLYKNDVTNILKEQLHLAELYQTSVQNVRANSWNAPAKSFYLSQLKAAIANAQDGQKEVGKASSFAQLRAIQLHRNVTTKLPEQYAGYPLYAAYVFQLYPGTFSGSAVTSLKTTLDQVGNKSVGEAKVAAYSNLYGHIASESIVKTSDKEITTYYAESVTTYALRRLKTELQDNKTLPDAARTVAVTKTDAALNAVGELAFGEDQTKSPSALYRSLAQLSVLGELSDYDGYSDLLRNYKSLASGGADLDHATYSANDGKAAYQNAQQYLLITDGYFASEIKAYKAATQTCYDARASHNKSGADLLTKEIKIAQQANDLQKKVSDLGKKTNPSASDQKQLSDAQSKLQSLKTQFSSVDPQLTQLDTTQTAAVAKCTSAIDTALGNIKAKADNHTAQLNFISDQAKKLYQ